MPRSRGVKFDRVLSAYGADDANSVRLRARHYDIRRAVCRTPSPPVIWPFSRENFLISGVPAVCLELVPFFFGGGWVFGTVRQFVPQAQYLSQRGTVAIVAEY